MKKILSILLLMVLTGAAFSQPAKEQPPKATTVKAKPKASTPVRKPVETRMLQGSNELYLPYVEVGDTLVYVVNAGGNEYDFIVAITYFNRSMKGISFNWQMTDPINKKGTVNISKDACLDGKKYNNFFSEGVQNLGDATTVFLSDANFPDMPDKKTEMTLDGKTETFYRNDNDEVPITITIHGKEYKLDGFRITNKEDGISGDKQLVISNSSAMPIILKMDIGFSIVLKEIR